MVVGSSAVGQLRSEDGATKLMKGQPRLRLPGELNRKRAATAFREEVTKGGRSA